MPEYPNTTIDYGVTWFLNQLMIFSTIYAFGCGEGWSPKVKTPSLLGFVGIAAVLGVLHSLFLLFIDDYGQFFALPTFWTHYLSYPIFFFSGALAQRNGWMDDIKSMSRIGIYSLAAVPTTAYMCYIYLLAPSLEGS